MNKFHSMSSKRGMTIIWVMVTMLVMSLFLAMGVDWGRVQVARQELRRSADAAARAGAGFLFSDPTAAINTAIDYAARNRVDGTALVLDRNNDVELGTWNEATKTFTRVTGNAQYNANAIRVIARRTAARGTAIPASMSRLFGRTGFDIQVESISMLVPAVNVDQDILATANPFLAGMPSGSAASLNNPHNSPDYAGDARNPRQSPQLISMNLVAGAALTFDSISGVMRHDPNLADYQPDGQLDSIGTNTNGAENGISDCRAPINALVGVFLTDAAPNTTAAPTALDFSTSDSRDFASLRPQVKQIFFIGDGLNSSGVKQEFIVPAGATRLYVAAWDFYEWNNNSGNRDIRITRPNKIVTVK